MSDVFSSEKRSWIMGRVKGKNTSPERVVRTLLHEMGFRFRLHRPNLPGKPDIVLPRHRAVIFVHGCFWHLHTCKRAAIPTTNSDFWLKKLGRNAQRDEQHIRQLGEMGWRSLVIWQCEIGRIEETRGKLMEFLGHPASGGSQ